MTTITLAAIAVLIERFVGYPPQLQKTFGHPVQWFGALIAAADKNLNQAPDQKIHGRLWGALALTLVLLATAIPAWLLSQVLHRYAVGPIFEHRRHH